MPEYITSFSFHAPNAETHAVAHDPKAHAPVISETSSDTDLLFGNPPVYFPSLMGYVMGAGQAEKSHGTRRLRHL